MIQNTVYVRASRADVRQILYTLPTVVRSRGAIADAMMVRCGFVALTRIRQAFLIKARGGTDEAGDKWQPLSPRTIAYRMTRSRGRGGRTRAERNRPTHPSQALNTRQRTRWWEVYRQQLAVYRGNKGHAAAVAWIVLKREGAVTLLQKYGGREVEILRDTGLLFNSLSPGVATNHRVFRVGNGEVIVGTNRKGAGLHHRGIPGRLPQRRLWPDPKDWPPVWWQDIQEQAQQGLLDLAVFLLGRIGP
jgi:hypothetical protein